MRILERPNIYNRPDLTVSNFMENPVAVGEYWKFYVNIPCLHYIANGKSILVHVYEKIVNMIRKSHNHKLQTNPWHREEEPHNNHETQGTQQSNQLSLPHQDDCKTRMETHNKT